MNTQKRNTIQRRYIEKLIHSPIEIYSFTHFWENIQLYLTLLKYLLTFEKPSFHKDVICELDGIAEFQVFLALHFKEIIDSVSSCMNDPRQKNKNEGKTMHLCNILSIQALICYQTIMNEKYSFSITSFCRKTNTKRTCPHGTGFDPKNSSCTTHKFRNIHLQSNNN